MMKVYGSRVSYYTGKLEAYLRYKDHAYEVLPTFSHPKRIATNAGAVQMPVVECADGRWMSDSTPIILELEKGRPTPSVIPEDPVVQFIAFLLEDYADEWLWRPAMHYRWSYAQDRGLLSHILAEEQVTNSALPLFLKRRSVWRRQLHGFVLGDGVRDETRSHVEAGYFVALDEMTRMLAKRPFLLGDIPSIADFGFMGPMLRHFGQDPTPAEIMRTHAPAVYEWVARMWNVRPRGDATGFVDRVPDEAAPLLEEVSQTHLQQLVSNAEAFASGLKRFSMTIQGCEYAELPVSRYRVACLEQLRERFAGLSEADQASVRALLPHPEAEILWTADLGVQSGYDEAREAPFNRAINVYGSGVPS